MRSSALMMAVLLAGVSGAALAAEASTDMAGTVVNLDAEAHKTVQQDRLSVTLAVTKTEPTAAAAQAEVNKAMQKAKVVYDAAKGVKVSTGSYNVWKQEPYEPGPKPLSAAERAKRTQWQARQDLTLDSADKEALLQLMGTLQAQGFASENMNYYLSREGYDAVKQELVVTALKSIRQQAKTVAEALDSKTVQFQKIDINDSAPRGGMVPMMARAVAMKADMAEAAPAPVAQAGESEVTVHVSAEVRLK